MITKIAIITPNSQTSKHQIKSNLAEESLQVIQNWWLVLAFTYMNLNVFLKRSSC